MVKTKLQDSGRGASGQTPRSRRALGIVGLLLVNMALFGLLEWGASLILDKPGLNAGNTRIFNAPNGRDAGFLVQYDERLGYRLARTGSDPSQLEDSLGRSFAVAKPAGVFRILCLGGSTTYGVGADKSNSYPAQLEDLLHRVYGGCGLRFEVLNLGVMGYHSWHSRIRFEAELAGLRPDLVVVMDAVNDLVASTVVDDSPAFVEEKERLLRLTNALGGGSLLSRLNAGLSEHSALYRLLGIAAHKFGSVGAVAAGDGPAAMRRRIESFGYRDNMRELAAKARTAGADCAIIDYPWLAAPQLAQTAPDVVRHATTDLYLFGRSYFPETNAQLARETGAAVIDAQPAFDAAVAARPDKAGEFYFDEIHLTKYGNQLLARQVLAGLPQVGAFARATAGCQPEDAANAARLDDPRVHFSNGWPRPGETPVPLGVVAADNIERDDTEYPGRVKITAADPSRPAVLRLTAAAAFTPQPMAYTAYPALWYPRVACATDRVAVTAAGQAIFSLAGTRLCRFTDVASRYGIDLPPLAPGMPSRSGFPVGPRSG
ncbi:SGNH/GDSL hydrolase family protein [Solidesulfovibrio sp.]